MRSGGFRAMRKVSANPEVSGSGRFRQDSVVAGVRMPLNSASSHSVLMYLHKWETAEREQRGTGLSGSCSAKWE